MKTRYFANDCLISPPHNTIRKELMKQVKDYSVDNPYYISEDKWCVDCEDAYQFTCAKDYQNLYEILYPNDEVEFKKDFYKDYNKMLNKIDKNIMKNPNITKKELIDAMIKGSAVENFLDTCINMRLNQHLNCVRREEHLNTPITSIPQENLKGDEGHQAFINTLKKLKLLGSKVNSDAKNHSKSKGISAKANKKYKNSRANSKRTLRSLRTRNLINKKKGIKY